MALSRRFYNTFFGRINEVIRDYAATPKLNISLAVGSTTSDSDASCGRSLLRVRVAYVNSSSLRGYVCG